MISVQAIYLHKIEVKNKIQYFVIPNLTAMKKLFYLIFLTGILSQPLAQNLNNDRGIYFEIQLDSSQLDHWNDSVSLRSDFISYYNISDLLSDQNGKRELSTSQDVKVDSSGVINYSPNQQMADLYNQMESSHEFVGRMNTFHGQQLVHSVFVINLVLSFINAFTLSLNSFVTLGFGTIPTKGLARYVCIIQGFLGWFLLSLFSVALINQVIF